MGRLKRGRELEASGTAGEDSDSDSDSGDARPGLSKRPAVAQRGGKRGPAAVASGSVVSGKGKVGFSKGALLSAMEERRSAQGAGGKKKKKKKKGLEPAA